MHRFFTSGWIQPDKKNAKILDNLLGRIMNQPDKKNQILISPGKNIYRIFRLFHFQIPASGSVENMMKKASFLWNIIILFAKADL